MTTKPSRPPGKRLLADFSPATCDPGLHVVNDNVMGGRSEGDFELKDGELHFTGRTVTDGGGFSSIRSGSFLIDLSTFAGIRLRILGDGRRYTLRLTTNARWQGRQVAYRADFDTQSGGWHTVDIPFMHFRPGFRGTQLEGPALDSGRITGLGVMIYDGRDGPFALRIASVGAYAAD